MAAIKFFTSALEWAKFWSTAAKPTTHTTLFTELYFCFVCIFGDHRKHYVLCLTNKKSLIFFFYSRKISMSFKRVGFPVYTLTMRISVGIRCLCVEGKMSNTFRTYQNILIHNLVMHVCVRYTHTLTHTNTIEMFIWYDIGIVLPDRTLCMFILEIVRFFDVERSFYVDCMFVCVVRSSEADLTV